MNWLFAPSLAPGEASCIKPVRCPPLAWGAPEFFAMALFVHNTLTKKKEPFVTVQLKVVRIYTCGLTVYAPMHIGHARTYGFWDMFHRYLEYRGHHVISVINYTDIDDRIIQRANEREGAIDVAERNIAGFRSDTRTLHIKDYAVYTRATDFICSFSSIWQNASSRMQRGALFVALCTRRKLLYSRTVRS